MNTLISRILTVTVLALAAGTFNAAPIPDDSKIGGFAIGCQAYSFNRFSVSEAIEDRKSVV